MLAGGDRHDPGADISEPMLQIVRARCAWANFTHQRDLRDVRVDTDGRFDLVSGVNPRHHVGDLEQALHQIPGLVAPGGRVVLVDHVAPRSAIPRRWVIGDAVRQLVLGLVRRWPVREAFALLRLATYAIWLHHVTSDRVLRTAKFKRRCGRVFPDARSTGLAFARARCWDAPPLN